MFRVVVHPLERRIDAIRVVARAAVRLDVADLHAPMDVFRREPLGRQQIERERIEFVLASTGPPAGAPPEPATRRANNRRTNTRP